MRGALAEKGERNPRHDYCKSGEGIAGAQTCAANEAIFESTHRNKEKTKTLEALAFGKIVKTEHLPSTGSQTEHLSSTGSHVYILTLKHKNKKKKAIFKVSKAGWMPNGEDRELAAVGISQIVGFDLVPLGLLRTLNVDGKQYSGFIQEWVPGKELWYTDGARTLVQEEQHYKRYNLIRVFDKIVQNQDRDAAHAGSINNYLLGKDDTLYAIDHQMCAFSGTPSQLGEGDLVGDGQIPYDAAQKIVQAAMRPAKLKEFLEHFHFLETENVQFVEAQLKVLAQSIEFKGGKAYVHTKKSN